MKLDDFGRPTLRYRISWGILVGITIVALTYAAWTGYENHKLIETNWTLVDLLDSQLRATEARMSRLEAVQRENIQVLLGDGPRVYMELLANRTER